MKIWRDPRACARSGLSRFRRPQVRRLGRKCEHICNGLHGLRGNPDVLLMCRGRHATEAVDSTGHHRRRPGLNQRLPNGRYHLFPAGKDGILHRQIPRASIRRNRINLTEGLDAQRAKVGPSDRAHCGTQGRKQAPVLRPLP